MNTSRTHFPAKSLLVLAISGALVACGGSSSKKDEHDHQHDHAHHGGRLIYSVAGANDTLKMYDQTVSNNRFTSTTVSANANAQLVLSNDGLTLALLDGSDLRVISSGLQHAGHTHSVESLSDSPITNVTKVIATTDHFSLLKSNGESVLIEAEDGVEVTGLALQTNAVYPTLALKGGQYMTFTDSTTTAGHTDITVINADGTTGDNGLIWVRPNDGGYFTESFSCADGVNDTAQTDNFTVVLCGDGTLRWLISGYVAPESHPHAGQTIHVTQRYPEVLDTNDNSIVIRREGAIGEVTAGGAALGFIENITGLTKTHHDGNVIAAWSADQLWLVNSHNDHPHRGNLADITGDNFGDIIAAAATTDDNAIAVLSNSGKLAVSRFDVNSSSNPIATGSVEREQLGTAGQAWSTNNAHLLAGAYEFLIVNRTTGTLYQVDAHDAEDDYHLHGTYPDASLQNAHSMVFAHAIDDDHDDDHEHDHHSGNSH